MIYGGMKYSNIYLLIFGFIILPIVIIVLFLDVLALKMANIEIYKNGILSPVPVIKRIKNQTFYHFDEITNIFITSYDLEIETIKGKYPIGLKMLGKNADLILQKCLEEWNIYKENKTNMEIIIQ